MKKQYDIEFKKEIVDEYLKGNSLNDIYQTYGIAKSTVTGWVKKYSEECHYTKPQNNKNNISSEEIRALNKKNQGTWKGKRLLKKSSGILRKGNRLVLYRFIHW